MIVEPGDLVGIGCADISPITEDSTQRTLALSVAYHW
jgi:hypothetical protein